MPREPDVGRRQSGNPRAVRLSARAAGRGDSNPAPITIMMRNRDIIETAERFTALAARDDLSDTERDELRRLEAKLDRLPASHLLRALLAAYGVGG